VWISLPTRARSGTSIALDRPSNGRNAVFSFQVKGLTQIPGLMWEASSSKVGPTPEGSAVCRMQLLRRRSTTDLECQTDTPRESWARSDFKFVWFGLGKDMAVTASSEAHSPVATLPTTPQPCKQEKTPWNSGPRACAQLQPRRLGCGTQSPHDDGGLQIITPHIGDDQLSYPLRPFRRNIGSAGGRPVGRVPLGPACRGKDSWTVSRRAPSPGRPYGDSEAQGKPGCRGVDLQPSAPADSPAPKGRRADGGTTPSLDQPQPARTRGPGAHTDHRDGQRSGPSQASPQQPIAPASMVFSLPHCPGRQALPRTRQHSSKQAYPEQKRAAGVSHTSARNTGVMGRAKPAHQYIPTGAIATRDSESEAREAECETQSMISGKPDSELTGFLGLRTNSRNCYPISYNARSG
jgi:hypothetical protein